jgi:iduronate 2-sulfatase
MGKDSMPDSKNRLNVLMLADHDLGVRLHCYGHDVVQSPNLDRLASRGRLFQSHFCAHPLCGPSRASLLTGRRPDTTRVFDNRTWFRHTLPDVVTLPAHFRAHGYWTGCAGAVFHGGMDDPEAWDVGGQPYRAPAHVDRDEYKTRADRHEPSDEPEESFVDAQTANRAIELLEQHADAPFFLAAGFTKPHVPLVAPRRYFDLYSINDIELPPQAPPDAPPIPECAINWNWWDIFMDRPISDEEARHAILSYHASTTFMDAQVGKILDTVDRLNLWENTIVVFWVDHGFHLGEHRAWGKSTLFDASTRVACIMAAPGLAQAGKLTQRLTEHLDIYPTLVELCGLPMPQGLEGTSFVPLLEDPDRPWKQAAFSQVGLRGRMVRAERWHYNRWQDGQEELYDMAQDPHQLFNRAQDPGYQRELAELRQIFDEHKAGIPATLP